MTHMSADWPRTILEAAQLLRSRRISPVELTRACLERIEALNSSLNAFILVTADQALDQAHNAEQEIQQGNWKGPLHGIPIALKDIIDTAGVLTTAASLLYRDRIPSEDAAVVRRLKQAGAVLLGKQNLHEFAYGGSSMISAFGEVHNPWNPDYIAGGSSGGSAAAVAAGMGFAAIGTDTAGSIREPAALCGVVGLKATYGRVSARGVIPLSQSLDHVGPLAQTVVDATVLLRALAEGEGIPPEDFLDAWDRSKTKLRVGVPRESFYQDLHPEVLHAVTVSLLAIASLGEQHEIPLTPDNDRTLQAAEAFAFHAASVAKTPELYQPETLRRIKTGENISQQEYQRKLAELRAMRATISSLFEEVDVIVTPTTPAPAPRIVDLKQSPDSLRPHELVLLRNTRPFNVWGLPTISIPCGLTKAGLPIGLQIAAAANREDLLLEFAYACEQALGWRNTTQSSTNNSVSS
jgi:aspartyl-tRNA(Asn)/glutamyl-tRNA(Gln) amidotransferase subunit A